MPPGSGTAGREVGDTGVAGGSEPLGALCEGTRGWLLAAGRATSRRGTCEPHKWEEAGSQLPGGIPLRAVGRGGHCGGKNSGRGPSCVTHGSRAHPREQGQYYQVPLSPFEKYEKHVV